MTWFFMIALIVVND